MTPLRSQSCHAELHATALEQLRALLAYVQVGDVSILLCNLATVQPLQPGETKRSLNLYLLRPRLLSL